MKVSVEAKRREAVKRMESAGFAEEIIGNFKQNIIMIYDQGKRELRTLTEEENAAMKKLESEKNNILIFFVIRTNTAVGLMDSFLYVSDEKDEWSMDREDMKYNYPIAYVKNYDCEMYSAFGGIVVNYVGGVPYRTA